MQKKRLSRTIFSVAAVLVAAIFLLPTADSAAQRKMPDKMISEDLLDLDIRTMNGEEIGEVRDILFDRNGRIKEFIVNVGGFLGIGERTVAVSTQELRFNTDEGFAVYQGTRSELEDKPQIDYYAFRFGRGYGPYPGPYGYGYGYRPYDPWRQYPRGEYYGSYGRDYYGRGYYGRGYEGGERQFPRDMERERGTLSRRDRDRRSMEGQGRYYPQGQVEIRGDKLSMDAITHADVRNRSGDYIGDIKDLIVDRRGQITHAIIEVGGFLGIGDKKVSIPFNELENLGPYFVIYPGTKEQLEGMPAIDMSQFEQKEARRENRGGTQQGQ